MEVDDVSDDASSFEHKSMGSRVIELRVGQQCFTTTRATLCKDCDSMLAKMFSGELSPSQKDSDGRFFIDRDGCRFGTILAYLRGDLVEIPASVKERAALAADAAFYQLQGLQDMMATGLSHADSSSSCSYVYEDIGNSNLGEAEALVLNHVKSCIGPAKVRRVCAALMRLYFGDRGQGAGDESAPNDDIMSVWNLGPSGRVCTFVSLKQWGSPWELPTHNEYGIPGTIPMEEIAGMSGTAFRKTICSYAGLFKQEMKQRGLLLLISDSPSPLTANNYRGKNVWRLTLRPLLACSD